MSEFKKRKTFPMTESGKFVADRCGFAPVLPPELLEIIFENVESAKDLLSCWIASPAWAAALRSTDFYFKLTLPFVLPYLTKKDLLECSSVSKCWRATVDVCILESTDTYFESTSTMDYYQRIMLQLSIRINRGMPEFISRFGLSRYNESGEKVVAVNPVAFRYVSAELYVDEPEEHEQFADNRSNLLTCLYHYGHLIRHLCISIFSNTVTLLDKLKLVRSCLQLTPNLLVLDIGATTDRRYGQGEDDKIDHEMETFKVYILEHPWPPLDHLKVLKVSHYSNRKEYALIANTYAPQLVRLKVSCPLVVDPMDPPTNRFSSLQKLYYNYPRDTSAFDFETFVRFSGCQLKQLIVVFNSDPGAENNAHVTTAVNAASSTLEILELVTEGCYINEFKSDIAQFEQLRLPELKVLRLHCFGHPSFPLLQSVCPALQKLTVTAMLYSRKAPKNAGTEMYSDLYSNHGFWLELAHIQKVDVQFKLKFENARKVYTRREYRAKGGKGSV